MLSFARYGLLSLALMLSACVTVNIYFPAAAAEEAARSIVRDVLGKEGEQAPAAEPSGDAEQSSALPATHAGRLLAVLAERAIAPARAADVDIDVSTPAIDRLRASMRQRQPQLAPFFREGVIGLTRDARVAIRDMGQVGLRDRNRVKQLVAADNADRDALYREIARANQHPEWEGRIREIFARVWIEEAPSGWWFQDQQGNWQQK